MPVSKNEYLIHRSEIGMRRAEIESLENVYMGALFSVLLAKADDIYRDFTIQPHELHPFWINYPPEQRGRASSGEGVPWLELGEKTISSHLLQELSKRYQNITFPGLPTGSDIRFSIDNVLIHLDVKLTGPNDNHHELVVPPNQVSGDGANWQNNGVVNSHYPVYFQRGQRTEINYNFQPKLPPFYIGDGKLLFCLTFFLKAIYEVTNFGVQPLTHFELACVPNGLLMFEPPTKYWDFPGLIIAGKDEKNKPDDTKRIRVRFDPLAQIAKWRCRKLVRDGISWLQVEREFKETGF